MRCRVSLIWTLAITSKPFVFLIRYLPLWNLVRWWAPSKFDPVKSPMLFFEKGQPVVPPLSPDAGLDMVLGHMVYEFFHLLEFLDF